jgi:gluconolactonase
VFASLPGHLRITDIESTAAAILGRPFDSFLEGLSFNPQGDLFCVDVSFGRVFRVDRAGEFAVVAKYPGKPSGLDVHPDGRLLITDRLKGFLSCNAMSGELQPVLSASASAVFQRLSDIAISAEGDVFITDPGDSDLLNPCGRVYRIHRNYPPELLLDGIAHPNGIAVDRQGKRLYVAAMRANDIVCADLQPPGSGVTRARNFVRLSGGLGPDGLGMDPHGRLAVAHFQFGCVWLYDKKGEVIARIQLERGTLPTSVTFGGPQHRHLYVAEAESGTIQVAEIPPEILS